MLDGSQLEGRQGATMPLRSCSCLDGCLLRRRAPSAPHQQAHEQHRQAPFHSNPFKSSCIFNAFSMHFQSFSCLFMQIPCVFMAFHAFFSWSKSQSHLKHSKSRSEGLPAERHRVLSYFRSFKSHSPHGDTASRGASSASSAQSSAPNAFCLSFSIFKESRKLPKAGRKRLFSHRIGSV